MKRANKYLSLALALIMALSLCVTSFAANIEVANPAAGETYKAYKIFDYTNNGDAFSYTIKTSNPWFDIVKGYGVFTLTKSATDETVYVVTYGENTVDAAHFANYLSTTLKAANPAIAADKTSTDGKFTGLDLGYWFVDTSLGSLCSLVNTDDEQTLFEKNSIPTIKKFVEEDSASWGETATADFNQNVNFKLVVNTGTDTYEDKVNGVDADYVIKDTIPAGMTYNNNAVVTDWATTDYEVAVSGQVVTITLKAAKLATLGENADIEITYSAKVNNNAVIGGNGNVNNVVLTYKNQTSSDSATVYTYEFNIFKYTGEKEALAGAKFVLKKVENQVTYYAQAIGKQAAGNDNPFGTPETEKTTVTADITGWTTVEAEATVFESPESGKIFIKGLDEAEYALEEIEAPEGYNLLTADKPVSVNAANDKQTIEVENKSGAILPGTGGVGTTMFYVLGSVMMIGAAVLLVTKKKMANEQ
ncbi:MAG: isopeptide-forming domain-containing fimbrial protein [Clostridia bacterium]|nr:isopeptide-forming domain-containing fimbrial protein [Clostridia bacterium]